MQPPKVTRQSNNRVQTKDQSLQSGRITGFESQLCYFSDVAEVGSAGKVVWARAVVMEMVRRGQILNIF